jgi:peptide/nickel transport system substrate-binding protein
MEDSEREREPLERRGMTRRELMIKGGGAAGAISLAWLLAACGGEDEAAEPPAAEPPPAEEPPATEAPPPPAEEPPATETVPAGGGGDVDSMAWVINGEAVSMDYALAYDFNTNAATTNICEPLLRFSPEGQLEPNLAESWEQVDPTTFVITLRSGVKFHDGSDMTAEDVAFSLNRHRDPDVGSYLATFHERVADVVATGDLEVTVTLSAPDSIFAYALATNAAAVTSQAWAEANAGNVGTPEAGMMGTGPYMFTSWTKGQEIVLDRFDDYWNTDRPLAVAQFVVKIILDEATIVQALTTGEVDGVFGTALSGKSVQALEGVDAVSVYRAPSYQVHYLTVNTGKPPWDDPRVRQALSTAIDKTGLLESTWGGIGTAPIKSPATPAMWTYEQDAFQAAWDALPGFDLDLEGAKALIDEAGAAGASGSMLVALPFDEEQAVAIQAAAAEIGLDLSPEKVEITDKIGQEFAGTEDRAYDMSVTQWGSDIPDPAGNLLVNFLSTNLITNNSAYKNPDVDTALNAWREAVDPAERAQHLIDAQGLIVPDQPWIVFYSPDAVMVLNNRLGGYQIRPLTYWDPYAADFSGV